jgi:ABC-type transporter Mla maintaining outer membrane lipid asymmetry permease subunit MlaE
MCKPYLSKGRTAWRDPFRLGRVYPDLLFLAGLVSAAILCVVRPWVGGVFLAVIGCHFMVHAGSAHGNIRYFYPLMTVCFVAAGVAGALIGQLVCRRNTEVES